MKPFLVAGFVSYCKYSHEIILRPLIFFQSMSFSFLFIAVHPLFITVGTVDDLSILQVSKTLHALN